jgi:hypothetical protein
MGRRRLYEIASTWTGDRGSGTAEYRSYDRAFTATAAGRPAIFPVRHEPQVVVSQAEATIA